MASSSSALFLAVIFLFIAATSACGPYCWTPTPTPPTPPSVFGKCPVDTLKLGVCANVLNVINAKVGKPPREPCCQLLEGLVDLEAAVCLCTAIKAEILGIQLSLPIHLSLILNYCGKGVPSGFQCP